VINIDESTLDQTYYIRKGWGIKGQKLFTVKGTRLNKFNIIAAASSHGAVWIQTNNGRNNSTTFWNFILNLILSLQEENLEWRRHTIFLLDNAQWHKSDYIMDKFVTFQIPVLFSGPYSYDGSPIEKIFASIKMRDLNPKAMSFKSRQTIETYVQWLTEEIVKINFGNVSTLFKQALEANKSYLLFNDI